MPDQHNHPVSAVIIPRNDSRQWKSNEPLQYQIARDKQQTLSLSLTAGQYAKLIFTWQGIDLSLAIFDSSGKSLLPATVPVSAPGPVTLSILATETGIYKIEISTPVRQKISGSFQVQLDAIRYPLQIDHNSITAQSLLAEASKQSALQKIEKYKLATDEWQKAQDSNSEAQTLMLAGDAYRSLNDLTNAKTNYESAEKVWTAKGNYRGAAYANLSLGTATRSLRSAKDAIPYFIEARRLFVEAGDPRGESSALYSQAFTHMSIGQTPQAVELLESSIAIRKSIGERLGEATASNMLADAYRLLGDLERSLALYDYISELIRGLEYRV